MDDQLYYLEQIAQSTDNTEVYTQSIMGDLVALRYELAEYHQEVINNNSVYLGCICLILMVTLLIGLLPAKKGVAKK